MSDDFLRHQAKGVLDQNRFMTLGTTEADGRPRVSPVYYTHDDYRDVYWVSSPEATHSQNLAARPDVVAVVFDSTATVGNTAAVYLTGRARMVPDAELARPSKSDPRCAGHLSRYRTSVSSSAGSSRWWPYISQRGPASSRPCDAQNSITARWAEPRP